MIPIDILNTLYEWRAKFILQDRMSDYNLNYNELCNFLKKYNGFISGSFALSCFDNSFIPDDLDIFVSKLDDHRQVYKDFFQVIDKIEIEVAVDKHPICNSSVKNDPTCYVYKFNVLGKKIDLVVLNKPLDFMYFNIECTNFFFDANKWKLPANISKNIHRFLIRKECSIGNPYLTYFSEIYDPWNIESKNILSENAKLFYLDSNIKIKNQSMRLIYNKVAQYYKLQQICTRYTCCQIEKYYINDEGQADYMHSLAKPIQYDDTEIDVENNYDNVNTKEVDYINYPQEYLNVALCVFKNLNMEDDIDPAIIFNNLYCVYRAWYRILKYISRGYIFVDIIDLMNNKYSGDLFKAITV